MPLLLLVALMLAGCETTSEAPVPKPLPKKITYKASRVHAPRMPAETKPAKPIPWPDAALLKRQPPPDCELKTQPAGEPGEVKLKTLDYERQCYKEVEGVVRARLDSLQDAVGETIKAVKGSESEAVGSIRK